MKIVVIKSCKECPWHTMGRCTHEGFSRLIYTKEFPPGAKTPDWCPLPDICDPDSLKEIFEDMEE